MGNIFSTQTIQNLINKREMTNLKLEEIENFADKSKSNADLAFVLLTIGGALIAIDK